MARFPSLRSVLRLAFALLAVNALASPEAWKAEIDALTAGEAAHPPPSGAVLFVGSSSIRLWKTLATDFPDVVTINRGFGGSELADSVYYADRIVLPYRPRLVVLFAGTNDLWAGKSPETVLEDFRAFRAKLHATLPATQLIYLSINLPPSRARVHDAMRRTNSLIAADCATDARCTFVDMFTPMLDPQGRIRAELFQADQLHLNPTGYAIWARVLAPYLRPPG